MKLDDLIEIAKKGQLTLSIADMGTRTKLRFIWDDKNEHIIGTKYIPYKLHRYFAHCEWQAENESYKITKKDYMILEKFLTPKAKV